jgi:hypothetical protein
MAMISLDLAGWRLCLDIEAPTLVREATARYASFIVSSCSPVIFTARVKVTSPGADWHTTPAMEASLRQAGDTGSQYRVDAPGFYARIDPARGLGEATLVSAAPLTDLEHFLRIAVALLAFHEGGLLIHAAGLGSEGGVRLFMGQSGSGKSTAVALSPCALALNDDLIILRPREEGWAAHGTPFWNMEAKHREGQVASGPVAGIYRLVQDDSVYLEPLSPATAIAELVANCPVINGSPSHLAALLGRCSQLVAAVPVQRLHFRKDGSFWRVLEQHDQRSRKDDSGSHGCAGSRPRRDRPAD